MNEQRLRELMKESVEGVGASDSLRTRISEAVGGTRTRRRFAVRGWIAAGGAGLAAAAVLLAVPLVRTPTSAPPGPGVAVTAPSAPVATFVDDIGEVLGHTKWYVIGIVANGSNLALEPPPAQAVDVMHIQLTGGILQGGDGCNALGSGPALLTSAPTVTVFLSATLAGCSPIPNGQEEFLQALRSGPKSWSRDGDLVVLTAAGIEVIFSTNQTAPLESSALATTAARLVPTVGASSAVAASTGTSPDGGKQTVEAACGAVVPPALDLGLDISVINDPTRSNSGSISIKNDSRDTIEISKYAAVGLLDSANKDRVQYYQTKQIGFADRYVRVKPGMRVVLDILDSPAILCDGSDAQTAANDPRVVLVRIKVADGAELLYRGPTLG